MAYLPRCLEKSIGDDLGRKMVFVGGPRQTGKTTLANHIAGIDADSSPRYLNWDFGADREKIIDETFPSGKGYLILDEVHKYSRWRQVVKGLFDKRRNEIKIIATGSARLDYYRKGGDSLQGRYHYYRLLPLTLGELGSRSQGDLSDLLKFGGFPEPFALKSVKETRRRGTCHSPVCTGDGYTESRGPSLRRTTAVGTCHLL